MFQEAFVIVGIVGSSGHSAVCPWFLQGVEPQRVVTGPAECFITVNWFGHAGFWLCWAPSLFLRGWLSILFTSLEQTSFVTVYARDFLFLIISWMRLLKEASC